jgi:EF hand
MKKLHFAALLSAFSILAPLPAAAQMMPDMPKTAMPKTDMPKTDMPKLGAPPAPEAAPTPPADAPKAMTVAEAVAADFAKYDKDGSGALSKAEFSAWIGEAKAKVDGKAPDPKALGEAFIKADVDKSKTVTADELTTYLS